MEGLARRAFSLEREQESGGGRPHHKQVYIPPEDSIHIHIHAVSFLILLCVAKQISSSAALGRTYRYFLTCKDLLKKFVTSVVHRTRSKLRLPNTMAGRYTKRKTTVNRLANVSLCFYTLEFHKTQVVG